MNSRVAVWTVGVWAACVVLVGAGCGGLAQKKEEQPRDYAKMVPAARLLVIEAEGPSAPGAIKALVDLLASENPVYRAEAAQTLGAWAAVGDPAIAIPAVTHKDRLVRSLAQASYLEHNASNQAMLVVQGRVVEVPPAVIHTLADLGDPQGAPPPQNVIAPLVDKLRLILHSPSDDEAVLAADLLSRVTDVGARRTLIRLVESSEGVILAKAARSCSRDDPDLGITLLPLAYSDGVLARRAAMEALVLRPNPWMKNLALKGLNDPDVAVRHNAIRALANMDGAAPVEPLEALLKGPGKEKGEILEALGGLGVRAAPVLREYIQSRPPDPQLMVALRVFEPFASRDDIGWVSNLLKSDNRHIRAAALGVLGAIGNPEAQPIVMAALRDPEPIVKARAVKALGQLHTTYAAMQLARMLDDPAPLIRSLAAWGLGQAHYADAAAALIKMAKEPMAVDASPNQFNELYGWPELSAVGSLGRIGGPQAVAALRELLGSPAWLMRAAAAQALAETNDRSPETLKALEALLQDRVNLVKAEARLSLTALGRVFLAD